MTFLGLCEDHFFNLSLRGARRRRSNLKALCHYTMRLLLFIGNDMYNKNAVEKLYVVYIITNKNNTVLYTGVTNDLKRRVYEHKEKLVKGFSSKYNLDKLVFYEVTGNVESAISREKQIKGGSRQKKIDLVNSVNPDWKDLYPDI